MSYVLRYLGTYVTYYNGLWNWLIFMFAMQKTRDFDNKCLQICIACGHIVIKGGYYFLQGLQLRTLLECRFYSREGLIWGSTVIRLYPNCHPVHLLGLMHLLGTQG